MIGVTLLSVALIFIFQGLFKILLEMTGFLETLIWTTVITLVIGSNYFSKDIQSWTLIIGSLLLPVALAFSANIRKIEPNMTRFFAILTIVWGAIAVYFSSSTVGFITVGSLISLLGFSIVVTPLCYAFGFDDKASIWRGTISSILMLSFFLLYRASGLSDPFLALFASGAFWLGSLSGFVGLLILSSRWYDEHRVLSMNVLAIATFLTFGSLAAIYNIRELTTMVGAFIMFYFADKIIEIKTEEMFTFGLKLLAAGLMFYGVWHYVHVHQDTLSKFFYF
jgi:hypothetical protein